MGTALRGDQPFGQRPLVVAAHPDDEIIGAGGFLLRHPGASVVHVTDGAPRDPRFLPAGLASTREEYAALRRAEAERALALAGLGPDRIRSLGIVDQEAAAELDGVVDELVTLLVSLRPDVVITHAYEGGHPDHDATALAVHAAAALLGRSGEAPPRVVEMTSYHGAAGHFTAGEFLPVEGVEVVTLALTDDERATKTAMLACHRSQTGMLTLFPVGVERFRPAPAYDFTRPPHEGPLHYERLGWPLDFERFQALARASLMDLGLGGEARL